jgi:hypothetical protein
MYGGSGIMPTRSRTSSHTPYTRAHPAVPLLQQAHDLRPQQPAAKQEARADSGLPAGFDEHLPFIARQPLEQHELHLSAAAFLFADEAGGNDPGVVDDQAISRRQIVRQIAKHAMRQGCRLALEHQQARGVPRFNRMLRNEPLGQVVPKILCLHGSSKVNVMGCLPCIVPVPMPHCKLTVLPMTTGRRTPQLAEVRIFIDIDKQ